MSFRVNVTFAVLVLACDVCIADSGTVRVCVIPFSQPRMARSVAATAQHLSDTLRNEKLRSGRKIDGVLLIPKRGLVTARQAKDAGCDYLVTLQPKEPLRTGMDQNAAIDSPLPVASSESIYIPPGGTLVQHPPVYRSSEGLDFPILNYQLERVGIKEPLTKGSQIATKNYETDYSALARKIAQKIN